MKRYKQRKRIELTKEYLEAEKAKGRSWNDIARELGTNGNYVSRRAKAFGIESFSKSEGQKLVLAKGKAPHPTAGKQRPKETKIKISNAVAKTLGELSDEDKQKMQDKARENWFAKGPEAIKAMRAKAIAAVRETSTEGSKMEKWILMNLGAKGYKPQFHRKDLIPNQKMIVDIFVPEINTVIEIDGPSHFLPIYGEDALTKSQRADAEKNALLIHRDIYVVRVKFLAKRITEKDKREIWEGLNLILEDIRTKTIVSPMVIRLERE